MREIRFVAGKLMWASPLLLFCCVGVMHGRVLTVPEVYQTITAAMSESTADDTILVNRGIYSEQLWFPAHRVTIMSHYELTGDTLDVTGTVIDGSSYADNDTATIALFLPGAADGSTLCGFTLTHGHGIGPGNFSGAFMAHSCSPVICHNLITGNETFNSPVGNFYYSSGEFLGNTVYNNTFEQSGLRVNYNIGQNAVLIEGNYFGPNPSSPDAALTGVLVNEGASAVIRNNVFRGLTGRVDLAISYHGRSPVITNNVFDSLQVAGFSCSIVWLYGALDIVMNDNIFSNIESEDGVVMILDGRNRFEVTLEGNILEHIRTFGLHGGGATAGLFLSGYNGVIRNNIFRSNAGPASAAVYVTGGSAITDPRGILIEFNLMQGCSALDSFAYTACIHRAGYDAPVAARFNLFYENSPRVVTVDDILRSRIADFRENWWGHPSGPYHPVLNPDGLGDTVGDSVLFEPWLTDSLIDAVDEPPAWIPRKTELISYPNPFNSTARLSLSVEKPGTYSVKLYSITGQLVRELWRGGVVISREITVDARDLSSGVYFATADDVETHLRTATVKMVLVK